MKIAYAKRLLVLFGCLEFGLAAFMFFVARNAAIGASQVAMGMSLIAVAAAIGRESHG